MKGLRVQLLAGDEEGACVLDGDEYFAETEWLRHSQPRLRGSRATCLELAADGGRQLVDLRT